MGSSAKKKKDKQKDFQKPKYKVGKTKAKPSNFTDLSFKAKSIVVGQQSLSTEAPDSQQLFRHNLSLASTSRSDKQRREALAFLTTQLAADPDANPVGTRALLVKLLPLVSDSSTPVRTQLLKLLHTLPEDQVKHSVEHISAYLRAGITHLSSDISNDSLGVAEWLLDTAADELVACPGGWVKTLNTLCASMGWSVSASAGGWTAGTRAGLKPKDAQNLPRNINALSKFLEAGFRAESASAHNASEYRDCLYRLPKEPNAFGYLNLSAERTDEDGDMFLSRQARQDVFHRRFHLAVSQGVERAKKEGGTIGRSASLLDQVLQQGMGDFKPSTAMDTRQLLELW